MAYIGRQQDGFGVRSRFIFTATGGQTTFTTDDSSNALSYSDGAYVDVYLNGVLLDPSDYTATSLTSIVLDSGASADDVLEVIVYDIFSVFSGTFTNGITASEATVTGDLTVDTNTLYVDSTNNRVGVGTSSPSYPFELSGTTNPILAVTDTTTPVTTILRALDSSGYVGTQTSHPLLVLTGGTERMRIDTSGRVGIGTTSPSDYFSGADQLVISGGSGDGGITINAGTSSDSRIHFADGTSGSEAYRGIVAYDHANDSLRFVSSGLEAMRIDSSGRVLQGTSSAPLKWWNGTTYGNLNLIENNNQTNANFYVTQGLVRNTADSEAAQLGFAKSRGTTSGSATVIQNGDALGILTFQGADGTNYVEGARISATCDGTPSGNDMPTRLQFYTTADGNQSSTERMRISSSGQLAINTTTFSNYAQTSGDSNWAYRTSNGSVIQAQDADDGFAMMYMNKFDWTSSKDSRYINWYKNGAGVGSITLTSGGLISYGGTSDYRLKENIADMTGAIDRIKQAQPKQFNMIDDPNDTTQDGFLAHELETVVPEAVTGTHNEVKTRTNVIRSVDGNYIEEGITEDEWTAGKTNGVYPTDSTWSASWDEPIYQMADYAKLTPLLTAALQEAIAKIETLEAKVTALENA